MRMFRAQKLSERMQAAPCKIWLIWEDKNILPGVTHRGKYIPHFPSVLRFSCRVQMDFPGFRGREDAFDGEEISRDEKHHHPAARKNGYSVYLLSSQWLSSNEKYFPDNGLQIYLSQVLGKLHYHVGPEEQFM